MATSMKMSGCMKLIAKMSEADQDALLQRLDQYEADGVPRERAQTMAAQDMLAEIQGERDSLFGLLQEQHPDLFTVSEEPAAAAQMSRQRAYHGTPHRGIDKFSTDKIGTGEGAQAYGWGLYFASKKEIAEWYRQKLTPAVIELDEKKFNYDTNDLGAENMGLGAVQSQGSVEEAKQGLRDALEDDSLWDGASPQYNGLRESYAAALEWLEKNGGRIKIKQGQLYEVEIPEDSEMLLWDTPLAEQNAAKWREIAQEEDLPIQYTRSALFAGRTGEDFYKAMSHKLGSDQAASQVLSSYGVKGIKYLDGGSRGTAGNPVLTIDGTAKTPSLSTPAPERSGDTRLLRKNGDLDAALEEARDTDAEPAEVAYLEGLRGKPINVQRADDGSYNYVVFSGDDVEIQQAFYSRRRQTNTPEFKRWFGDSKVVDKNGEPLVMYHGAKEDIEDGVFRMEKGMLGTGAYFTSNPKEAEFYTQNAVWRTDPNIVATYVSIKNPYYAKDKWDKGALKARENGHDGVILIAPDGGIDWAIPFSPTQIKSAIGNTGAFDPENPNITKSTRRNIYGQPLLANWTMPTDSKLLGLDKDSLIYRLQDKQIDLKRVIEGVTAATGQIDEKWNAYLKEELYHGRTAKATKDFIGDELRPLLQGMDRAGVSMSDFETYLHNRHAEERNIQIAKINPAMPDGGSGIDTADARSYLAGLDPAKRQTMEALAKQVDAITKETRELLVRSGLETRETIDKWEAAYGKYVPLIREDLDFSADLSGTGTGQGYSVRGPSSKRATGSKREVVDILANLAMQRERAIVRAEKTRVGTALYGLALKNPNPDFWLAVNPDAIKDPQALAQELIAMGLDPLDAKSIAEEPKQATVDPRTGLVSQRINPALRSRDNVFAVRINGQDRFLFFNTKDERAARMVASLKNLDADQLGAVMGGVIAPVTRWFASVNTQYNPIFGAVNLIRDTQGALVNLSTTDIADRKAQVFRGIPGAMAGIYSDLRKERKGGQAQGQWAALWEEFQKAGGQTGFRDMFKTSEDRTKALQAVMDPSSWADSKLGKVFTAGGALKMPLEAARKYAGAPLFDWLSDYNETLENAVRLSAYKAAKDKGLSTEKAASIAKNLTVNFNRKGQVATQMGALWAFFNAAVQGSARLYDTLTGPAGRKIMAGGLLLGTLQAVSLALMGFDEDEPPEFVKERNLVVPLGESGKYLQLPMPLGLHVIPSTSRIITEWIMSGFKDTTKRVASLANLYLEAFNPVGNAATLIQTLSPTFADPLVALAENKDWQGRPIYKEDRSGTDPTPGYTRARDTATWFSKELAYYLNLIGGTKYTRGVFSPTPDQIDYLFAQAGGGVMREAQKISQAVQSSVTGEELPSYKIPLGGRFFGDIKEQSAVQSRFYDNLKKLNEHEREIEGRRKNREGGIQEYLRENPEARLANIADRTEREVQELRRRRREMIEKDRPKESIKMIEAQITRKMQQLNDRVEQRQEAVAP